MAKGAVTAAEASQHHAGVRVLDMVLEEVLGLNSKEGQWRKWVAGHMPRLHSRKLVVCIMLMISTSLHAPKAAIGGAFGDRIEKPKIKAWRWQTAQEIANGMGWSNDGRQFVDKLRTGELRTNGSNDREHGNQR